VRYFFFFGFSQNHSHSIANDMKNQEMKRHKESLVGLLPGRDYDIIKMLHSFRQSSIFYLVIHFASDTIPETDEAIFALIIRASWLRRLLSQYLVT
jgi:hypothetical protein